MSFSKLLIGLGIIFIISATFFYFQQNNPQRLSFAVNNLAVQSDAINSALPTEIIIKDLSLDLPIIPAKLENGKWEATTKGVSFLSSSPIPGEAGNSILYGHNWPNLLGNIVKLKPGQTIKIKYADGKVKEFTIDSTATVSPKDIGILSPSEKPQITLYTCSGFLDNKRFVIVAKLTS